MEPIIVVVGPTAVGKTKLGIELAKLYDGEIISGDALQVYRGMDIGTAKVTVEEKAIINHHLVDILNPDQPYSVAQFQANVRQKIQEIQMRNKRVIIVGGTGLYIKAALYDYVFEKTAANYQEYIIKYQDLTNEELLTRLKVVDQASAEKIHVNNRQRLIRALEIYETTGTTKSAMEAKQEHKLVYPVKLIGLTLDRDVLYQRINHRVDLMMAKGLEKEIRSLLDQGYDFSLQAMKAIGYKEWQAYFAGNRSLEEVGEQIKKNSRNFAKRQYTWFNNQMNVNWIKVDLEYFSKTIKEATMLIDAG